MYTKLGQSEKSSDMIRNSRTPTLIFIAIFIVFSIMTYNYWNLLDQNTALKDNLIADAEKLYDLNEKKSFLEKQNANGLVRIKSLEQRAESSAQSIEKQESVINALTQEIQKKSAVSNNLSDQNKALTGDLVIFKLKS